MGSTVSDPLVWHRSLLPILGQVLNGKGGHGLHRNISHFFGVFIGIKARHEEFSIVIILGGKVPITLTDIGGHRHDEMVLSQIQDCGSGDFPFPFGGIEIIAIRVNE